MPIEHPYLLATAVAVAVVCVRPLFQYFFYNWSQLAEDATLTSSEDRKIAAYFLALGGCFGSAHFQLNFLGFLFVLATIVATTYHLLAIASQWIR